MPVLEGAEDTTNMCCSQISYRLALVHTAHTTCCVIALHMADQSNNTTAIVINESNTLDTMHQWALICCTPPKGTQSKKHIGLFDGSEGVGVVS